MIGAMFFRWGRGLVCAIAFVYLTSGVWPQNAAAGSPGTLSAIEIVELMQRYNRAQIEGLKHYEALRHYHVEYRGLTTLDAKMDVEVKYDAATGKSFRIVSQSGSSLLCNKVLKRAVDSEKEAAQDKGATALNPANYRFLLSGSESLGGRPAYILDVTPLTASKFLYRGKIWVDAMDFALVKMETEPAKSPSFWISRTLIHYSSAKAGAFWLPHEVRSETKVRIGGTAMLTIDNESYKVVSNFQ